MEPQVNFLLDTYCNEDKLDSLVQIIENRGCNVKMLEAQPFGQTKFGQFRPDDCVIFFGCLNVAMELQQKCSWVPGVWCNQPEFLRSRYYGCWYKYLWNQDAIFVPWGTFKARYRKIVDQIYRSNGQANFQDWNLFIAPDDGMKSFSGQIIGSHDPEVDIRHIDMLIRPKKLILVSSYRRPLMEWRFFCSQDSGVITGSRYRVNGQLETDESKMVPQSVIDYLNKAIRDIKDSHHAYDEPFPDRLFVADVGIDGNNKLGIIELNSFSCSGFYQADLEKIIDASINQAILEWNEVH